MMALPETGWLNQDWAKGLFFAGICIAVFGGLSVVASWCRGWRFKWTPAWHLKFDGVWPLRRLITVHDAAKYAYLRIRHRSDVQILEKLNKRPDSRLGMIAQFLLNDPGSAIPLFGSKPPFSFIERIPEEDAETFKFSDDARELISQFDDNIKYLNIAMMRRDLRQRLRELEN